MLKAIRVIARNVIVELPDRLGFRGDSFCSPYITVLPKGMTILETKNQNCFIKQNCLAEVLYYRGEKQ